MSKRFVAAALLTTALVSGAAIAQTSPPAPAATPAPSASTTTTTTVATNKMNIKGNWRASKLIGLDVYNEANEKLGDINELILDKDGKVNAVVIGVGGFLGMGEHDIAVTMDKLKFVEEPVRTSATTTERRDTTTTTAPATTTTTAPATTTTTTGTAATPPARTTTTTTAVNDWIPDHAVMSGTKDQLKAMPQFKYSDYN
jgi:sporulation protein YlmC with PRC-barrel domain